MLLESNSLAKDRRYKRLRLVERVKWIKVQRVVIDITHDLFAHGHLYVALTRVIHPDYVRFYVSEKELTDLPGTDLDKCVKVNNIVHKHIVKKVCPRAYS